jgi:hypothetical protein
VVATDLEAKRWHIVCDNLNIHQSASLVCWVAQLSGIDEDLGVKGETGILASMASRAAFLSDPTRHPSCSIIRAIHSSWMNQMEIWLRILVRKLLKRGSFTSVEDLQAKVLTFIDYYNRTMAKPFKWTYQGKALTCAGYYRYPFQSIRSFFLLSSHQAGGENSFLGAVSFQVLVLQCHLSRSTHCQMASQAQSSQKPAERQ